VHVFLLEAPVGSHFNAKSDKLLAREKLQQAATAANYLCGYADKYALLVGAGKLEATEDLGEDAKDLANAITGTGFYCDM
jgi:hypothetical protein